MGLISAGLLLQACKKDEQPGSGRELLGTWVDINHTSDTLVFYKQGSRVHLFDNSLSYRTARQNNPALDRNFARFEIRLGTNTIAARPVGSSSDFGMVESTFEWIEKGKEFTVAPNAFRLYLSCIGCMQQFRKIN